MIILLAMEEKKKFKLSSEQLISFVDFLKWTSSFSGDLIRQMESPLPGVAFAPALSDLFALAKDDVGWMLVMHEKEGHWLANLPVAHAFVGYGQGLVLATEEVTLLEQPFLPVGIDCFIPHQYLVDELKLHNLIGFGLMREASNTVERVNRVVTLYTPERYDAARVNSARTRSTSLFAQR